MAKSRAAKRGSKSAMKSASRKKQPRTAALPGMEDHAIRALDNAAASYADIRDQRMALTKDEHDLKIETMKLMKKYDKTIYRHNGVTIQIVSGEDDVKVKIAKPSEDGEEDASGDGGSTLSIGNDPVEETFADA